MTGHSNGSLSMRIVLVLTAVAVSAIIGVLATIPIKQNRVTAAPDAISLAIRDLQASQQQVVDQLKTLQETVSSDRADPKRLSDEVAALREPRRCSFNWLDQRLRRERLCEIGEAPGVQRSLANGRVVVPGHVDDRH